MCDLAVAASGAKPGHLEVAAPWRRWLRRTCYARLGERVARYLLLTGELIDAAEAQRVGFSNAVVPTDQVLPRALEWAGARWRRPQAIARTKELLGQPSEAALSIEGGVLKARPPRADLTSAAPA
ncbi:MAG: enoyl-CoA hydratase-related protein [Gemmataceae bacterium]